MGGLKGGSFTATSINCITKGCPSSGRYKSQTGLHAGRIEMSSMSKQLMPWHDLGAYSIQKEPMMAQHDAAQHSTVAPSIVSVAQRSPTQASKAQRSTSQHSTAQHSTAQHSTAQHSTAQHSTCGSGGSGCSTGLKVSQLGRVGDGGNCNTGSSKTVGPTAI